MFRKEVDSFIELVKDIIPKDWKLSPINDWIFCYSEENNFPEQGWKIHISATVLNAEEILRISVPIICSFSVNFKFLKDKSTLALRNSRIFQRGGSGKFITIYPPDDKTFKELLERLYENLKDMVGPYILSDMRYKDCRVLYYRYGGFVLRERIKVDGTKVPIILTPDGKPYDDIRLPYYSIPPWVEDPFGNEPIKPPREIILKGKYKVISAIQFSNNGGVYEALDIIGGNRVVIKEARPYVSMDEKGTDAVMLLKKEYEILNRMKDTDIVPKPYELFQEWEHWFLVEEFVDGIDLRSFVALYAPVLNTNATDKDREEWLNKFLKIIENIAIALETFHSNKIVVVDISPNNILLNPQTLKVKFIDFEGAYIIGSDNYYNVFTPGMASPRIVKGEKPRYEDDYYAFAMIIHSLLFTNNHLFHLAPKLWEQFFENLLYEYKLPKTIKEIIKKNLSDNPTINPTILVKRIIETAKILKRPRKPKIDIEINNLIGGLIRRLKNNNFKIYADLNGLVPFGFAYGYTGIYYVLKRLNISPPKDWLDMILKFEKDEAPPGLYVGLCGVAWALWDMGMFEESISILKKAWEHQLIYEDGGIFYGVAGYGLTNLKFYYGTKEEIFLKEALKSYEWLLRNAKEDNGTLFLPSFDGSIKFGYGHGGAGISLFLGKLYEIVRDERVKEASFKFLKHTLKAGREINGYISWPSEEGRTTLLPYVEYGTAGVVGVLVRLYKIFKENWILDYINRALPDLERKFTIFSGQLLGLAGLGESLLDVELFLGKRTRISKILDGLKLFAVESGNGEILYPTDNYQDFTDDWGTASAGILDFLLRFKDKREARTLWDF